MNNFENLYVRQQSSQKNTDEKEATLCNKKTTEIVGKLKQNIFGILNQHFKFDTNDYTLLKQPKLLNEKYLVSMETQNSHKFMLILITIKNKKYTLLLTGETIYSVSFRFSDELYNGTIFNGEITKNEKDCWIFYINDIFYHKGQYIQGLQLQKKLSLINDILKNDYVFDDVLNTCHIQIKSFFLLNHLNFIKKSAKLLFVPDYSNMPHYFLNIDVEIKEPENPVNQIKQFITRKTDTIDVYKLYDIETKIFMNIACISKMDTSLFMKEQFKNNREQILQYKYNTYFNAWEPLY